MDEKFDESELKLKLNFFQTQQSTGTFSPKITRENVTSINKWNKRKSFKCKTLNVSPN